MLLLIKLMAQSIDQILGRNGTINNNARLNLIYSHTWAAKCDFPAKKV